MRFAPTISRNSSDARVRCLAEPGWHRQPMQRTQFAMHFSHMTPICSRLTMSHSARLLPVECYSSLHFETIAHDLRNVTMAKYITKCSNIFLKGRKCQSVVSLFSTHIHTPPWGASCTTSHPPSSS